MNKLTEGIKTAVKATFTVLIENPTLGLLLLTNIVLVINGITLLNMRFSVSILDYKIEQLEYQIQELNKSKEKNENKY